LTDILSSAEASEVLAFALISASLLTIRRVLREPITEFRGRSCPERCPSGGISAPLARIPVYVQSGHAFTHTVLGRVWRHSKPVMDRFYHGSILHAFSLCLEEGLIRRTFHEVLWHYCAYMLSAIHLLTEGRSFLAYVFVTLLEDLPENIRVTIEQNSRKLPLYEYLETEVPR